MISDEKLKENLTLYYKISMLYLNSGASTAILAEATGVSLATVKRSLSAIGDRLDDYLRLLPELGTSKELVLLQDALNEKVLENKKTNKWTNTMSLIDFKEYVNEISELYHKNKTVISEETRNKVKNLRVDGESMRKIANNMGISLGSVHGIINKNKNK